MRRNFLLGLALALGIAPAHAATLSYSSTTGQVTATPNTGSFLLPQTLIGANDSADLAIGTATMHVDNALGPQVFLANGNVEEEAGGFAKASSLLLSTFTADTPALLKLKAMLLTANGTTLTNSPPLAFVKLYDGTAAGTLLATLTTTGEVDYSLAAAHAYTIVAEAVGDGQSIADNSASFAVVGAITPLPEPGTWELLAIGLTILVSLVALKG